MARSIDDDIVFGFKAPLLSGFFILFRDSPAKEMEKFRLEIHTSAA
jgi:hypothetical protein|tara:strand:- start:120 stop:257 length:138 start_codon:yes stop_codon:yes gene_type:complete